MSTRQIFIGKVPVGGGAAVTIQSMCNTPTADTVATLEQINRLAAAGCQIIRLAVPDAAAAEAFKVITAKSPIPVIADIHFDYRLAVATIENGAAAVRVNPGNLGGTEAVEAVAKALKKYQIPVRVGANSGSLPKDLLQHLNAADPVEHDELLSDALVESVLRQAGEFEHFGVKDIKVSLKASSVPATVKAYRKFAQRSILIVRTIAADKVVERFHIQIGQRIAEVPAAHEACQMVFAQKIRLFIQRTYHRQTHHRRQFVSGSQLQFCHVPHGLFAGFAKKPQEFFGRSGITYGVFVHKKVFSAQQILVAATFKICQQYHIFRQSFDDRRFIFRMLPRPVPGYDFG